MKCIFISLWILTAGLIGLTGCSTQGRTVREGFSPVANRYVAPHPNAIQVIVPYGQNLGTHTAVRILHEGEVTFFDPGGEYPDLPDRTFNRKRDVIRHEPHSLEEYWQYRLRCGEMGMVVFEWDIPSDQGKKLVSALRDPDPKVFDPETQSGYCTRSAIDFLNRFFSNRIGTIQPTFSPDALATGLWERRPDTVILYKKNQVAPEVVSARGCSWELEQHR